MGSGKMGGRPERKGSSAPDHLGTDQKKFGRSNTDIQATGHCGGGILLDPAIGKLPEK